MDLNDPVATALRVADALDRAGHGYALYGGLLLAAYGEPRETRDVDIAIIDLTADAARQAIDAAGLPGSVAFENVTFGGLTLARVALVGGEQDTGLNVLDLVQPRSPRYRSVALDRSVVAPLRDRTIRALSADDFVIFKLLATRDRDLDDAVSVLRRSDELLDLDLIESEIRHLSSEIEDWNVRDRWATVRERASAGS